MSKFVMRPAIDKRGSEPTAGNPDSGVRTMNYEKRGVTICCTAMMTFLLGMPINVAAEPPYEIVLVQGNMSDTQDIFVEKTVSKSGNSANVPGMTENICKSRARFRQAIGLPAVAAEEITGLFGAVGQVLGNIAGVNPTPEQKVALDLYDGLCGIDRKTEAEFSIVYSNCSMLMLSERTIMRLVLPTDGGDAEMQFTGMYQREARFEKEYEMIDAREQAKNTNNPLKDCHPVVDPDTEYVCTEYAPIQLRQRLDWLFQSSAADVTQKGTLLDKVKVDPKGGHRTYLGVETNEIGFKYEGKMHPAVFSGEEDSIPWSIGDVRTVSEGTAWVAPDAPGAGIVAEFYKKFANQVVTKAEEDTLIGGMIYHLAMLSKEGLPLKVSQDTAVRVTGLPTIGQKSRSESTVTGVATLYSSSEWCARVGPPDDFGVMTLEELFQMSANPPGGSGTSIAGNGGQQEAAAGMAEAMSAMNQAMQSMTPEQRQMMEQMGLAVPGAGGGATAVAPSGMTAANDAASSAALTSSDAIQSAQSQLQALGYEPGNTDGALDMMTQVAVSQFQAEHALQVTGEVTPQLLGILAAEVDRQVAN